MADKSKSRRDTSKRPDGQNKKMMIPFMLDVLRRYTDDDHKLSITEIVNLLKRDHGLDIERKSVRRNLEMLVDCGYPVCYEERCRTTTSVDPETGEQVARDSTMWVDIYLERDFTDSELRLLIDSLLFSRHIPNRQCRDLVGKLENLSGVYFHSRVKHILTMPETQAQSPQLFSTIDILDEAIDKKRQVAFHYCKYGTDKKFHPQTRADGSVREYIINPYQMAAKEGKYYLICNFDGKPNITNYRVDRITDIRLLDSPCVPYSKIEGADGESLNLGDYITEHIYMYSGENERVDFRVKSTMISDVIDMFGTGVHFYDETDGEVSVWTKVNVRAMRQFALSFAPDVIILSPQSLVDEVTRDMSRALERYDAL